MSESNAPTSNQAANGQGDTAFDSYVNMNNAAPAQEAGNGLDSPSTPYPTNTAPAVSQSAQQQMPQAMFNQLTQEEIGRLKDLLRSGDMQSLAAESLDSDYPEFGESTTAWAIFADDPQKRANSGDRMVGTMIIIFQLFTYWMFASEAIEDYESGQVYVTVGHEDCMAADEQPDGNLQCEAEYTNNFDAFIAFSMLGIFLASDFIQAYRVLLKAPLGIAKAFAALAAFEVVAAYISACIAIGYQLFVGEATDAVEVGVGLLFIRELSQRAYTGIREGKSKNYKTFFGLLAGLIAFGMCMDPICEHLFAR